MPRKRASASTGGGGGGGPSSSTSSSTVSDANDAIIAHGGGTRSDLLRLSRTLDLNYDAALAVMNCEGRGIIGSSGGYAASTRRGGGDGGDSSSTSAAATATLDPAMMNVWGDFMSEEMDVGGGGGGAAAIPSGGGDAPDVGAVAVASPPSSEPASGPREYALPVRARMRLLPSSAGKRMKSDEDDDDDEDDHYPAPPAPGLLAQTGTLDASVPGRSTLSKSSYPHELQSPTILFPSIFVKTKIAFVATSSTSCHSVAITVNGIAYGWGRNETGQLGLGETSSVVPVPTILSAGEGEDGGDLKFVGAGVGKYHTILVGDDGRAYASGGNPCGQLGINNAGTRGIDRFRRCVVAGAGGGGGQIDGDGGEDDGGVKIVQASCGENISALLSSSGHLYTAGSSEFGQLGNGETGEHIVSAGKLGYSNCAKFVRRSVFVQSESDRDGVSRSMMTNGAMDSKGKVKCVTLEDSGRIRLMDVSCGRNHLVAVEAPSPGHVPRVFTWGCGDYGCLGHGMQADEYHPRLVGAFRGPVFANNHPVSAVAGGNCTLVLTRIGHVYYVGRHKSTGEATMRPSLVDALANNGHVATCVGAGSQTIFCSTRGGVTISWGNGSHGELGYGRDGKKSSAKPEFVGDLDSCIVTDVACGMGHTLFIVRNDDDEDAKALKRVGTVDESDLGYFLEQIKGRKVDAGADGEPAKKKQKGKGKK